MNAPVIAIDGPSASGKGTIARRVADALGFHYLESGALYRVLGLISIRENSLDEIFTDRSSGRPNICCHAAT